MATIQTRLDSDGKKSYRVMVRLKGAPPETATFTKLTKAREWAASKESAIREGRHFKTTEGKRRTLSEAITRYRDNVLPRKRQASRHSQRAQFEWWDSHLGAYHLADVTPAMIAECRDRLLNDPEKPRSEATTVRYMAALSHLFSVAVREWGWCEDNPCKRVTKPAEPRGRVRYLFDAERAKLLTACRESDHPDLYLVVLLALSTGGRRSEILGLRWPEVNLQDETVTFLDTKNNDRRTVSVDPAALAILKDRSRIRHLHTDKVLTGPDPRAAWESAVKAAGIDDFHFHDLRHSAASYLAMSGATAPEIAAVLGHRTLAMVKRYSHIGKQHTQGVMRRMHEKFLTDAESEAEHG
jgi:integrase